MLGIIASLIFVGLEIQQNSAIAKVEAQHRFTDQILSNVALVVENLVLLELMSRSFAEGSEFDVSALTSVERTLIGHYYGAVLLGWEAQYSAYRSGVLEFEEIQFLKDRSLLDSVYLRSNWDYYKKNTLSDEFVAFFEEEAF